MNPSERSLHIDDLVDGKPVEVKDRASAFALKGYLEDDPRMGGANLMISSWNNSKFEIWSMTRRTVTDFGNCMTALATMQNVVTGLTKSPETFHLAELMIDRTAIDAAKILSIDSQNPRKDFRRLWRSRLFGELPRHRGHRMSWKLDTDPALPFDIGLMFVGLPFIKKSINQLDYDTGTVRLNKSRERFLDQHVFSIWRPHAAHEGQDDDDGEHQKCDFTVRDIVRFMRNLRAAHAGNEPGKNQSNKFSILEQLFGDYPIVARYVRFVLSAVVLEILVRGKPILSKIEYEPSLSWRFDNLSISLVDRAEIVVSRLPVDNQLLGSVTSIRHDKLGMTSSKNFIGDAKMIADEDSVMWFSPWTVIAGRGLLRDKTNVVIRGARHKTDRLSAKTIRRVRMVVNGEQMSEWVDV